MIKHAVLITVISFAIGAAALFANYGWTHTGNYGW